MTEADIDAQVDREYPFASDFELMEDAQQLHYMDHERTDIDNKRNFRKRELRDLYKSRNQLIDDGFDELSDDESDKLDKEFLQYFRVPLNGGVAMRRKMWRKKQKDPRQKANALDALYHTANIVVAYVTCSECMNSGDAYKDENNGCRICFTDRDKNLINTSTRYEFLKNF